MLEVQELRTYFFTSRGKVKAVDNIDMRIEEGEAIGLVGESGCGKTTVAFSLINLVSSPGRIVSGRILYKGRDLLRLNNEEMEKVRGKEISMVFQDPMTYLNPVIKIWEQIADGILVHEKSIDKRTARNRVIHELKMVGMPEADKIADMYPHQLSGGMRQRALIASAFSLRPSLLILDEPTTALDATIQMQILHLLKTLREETGVAVLLITHDLGIVADLCDRVCIMYCGEVVEEADVYSLYKTPKHPYTVGLFDSLLSIDEFKANLVTINGFVPDLVSPPKGCRFHPRCHRVMPVCSEETPQLFKIDKTHSVRCWLWKGC